MIIEYFLLHFQYNKIGLTVGGKKRKNVGIQETVLVISINLLQACPIHYVINYVYSYSSFLGSKYKSASHFQGETTIENNI